MKDMNDEEAADLRSRILTLERGHAKISEASSTHEMLCAQRYGQITEKLVGINKALKALLIMIAILGAGEFVGLSKAITMATAILLKNIGASP